MVLSYGLVLKAKARRVVVLMTLRVGMITSRAATHWVHERGTWQATRRGQEFDGGEFATYLCAAS